MRAYTAKNTEDARAARARLATYLKTLETRPTKILEAEVPVLYAAVHKQTPKDTGKLRESIKVRVSRSKNNPGINASASARTRNFNYSYIQHENLSFKHRRGKAKYISDPMSDSVERIKSAMREQLQPNVGDKK